MIPVLVSALMWLLVACLLILRRGRAERSILYAAVTIAISMSFNIDTLYVRVDRVFGGTNLVTLVADLALMAGVFFLGRAVSRAAEYSPRAVRFALGRTVFAIALLGAVITFFFIDCSATTTIFMLELGGQPATAAYSMIQFTYEAVVLAAMAAVAVRQVRKTAGAERLPALSLLLGSALGITLSVVIIVMDIAHLVGDLALMLGLGEAYEPLVVATFGFLCAGLAGQPAVRRLRARARADRTRELVAQLTPTWQRASIALPGLSQVGDVGFADGNSEARLHREIVEIRDAVIDPRVSFSLTAAEIALVDEAEAQLIGGAPLGSRERARRSRGAAA